MNERNVGKTTDNKQAYIEVHASGNDISMYRYWYIAIYQ